MKFLGAEKNGQKMVRQMAFSIFDEKASAYNLPFFYPQVPLAVRAFTDMLQNPNSVVSRHPADFSLYSIGSFDDNSGKLESSTEPVFIARGSEILNDLKSKEVVNAN